MEERHARTDRGPSGVEFQRLPGGPLAGPAEDRAQTAVFRVTMPPGSSTGWHYHERTALGFVVSGTLTRYFADDPDPLVTTAGDPMVEAPGAARAHCGLNLGPGPLVLYAVFRLGPGQVPSLPAPAPWPHRPDVARRFHLLDLNGDGHLDHDDLVALSARLTSLHPAPARAGRQVEAAVLGLWDVLGGPARLDGQGFREALVRCGLFEREALEAALARLLRALPAGGAMRGGELDRAAAALAVDPEGLPAFHRLAAGVLDAPELVDAFLRHYCG